jgi:hypothetical protein
VFAPLIDAASAKLPFLKAQILEPIHAPDVLPIIDIVQPEGRTFYFALYVRPDEGLNTFKIGGEQPKLQLGIQILGDYLAFIAHFEHHRFAVLNDRHPIIPFFRQLPDQRTVLRRDLSDSEGRAGEFQDPALNEAKWAPRKLNQFDHLKKLCTFNACTVGLPAESDKMIIGLLDYWINGFLGESINPSIHQSINPSIHQSINPSIQRPNSLHAMLYTLNIAA